MGKLLALACKDFRVLIADRGNLFWVFVFPAIFALLFGAVYSGAGDGPSGMKVAVVDDDNSTFSQRYVSHLEEEEALEIARLDREQALEQVRKGNQAAAILIQPGFGEGLGAMFDVNEPRLQIAQDPGRRMEGAYLQGLLAKAQFEVMGKQFQDRQWMREQMDTWRAEMTEANDLSGEDTSVFLRYFDALDTFLEDVNDQTYSSGLGDGLLNIATVDVQREYDGPRTPFQITFPQAMIFGILGCAATFAVSIVRERTSGTFQRLCVGPISQAHVLAGKGLACAMTCAMVIGVLTLGGSLVFHVPIGSPPLFVLGAACTVLCFVGLMMFISTLGKTEQSVGGAGWAILMIMAMFGGAMMPLAFMPSWMRNISHFSPIKWAILAMEGAIWRDFRFTEMLVPCAVLIAVGAVFFTLGVFMLRKTRL
ncbi:MAG: ABC transporter permease [Phycisphaerae bacterium]|nr:ABC transporter permease [Phycisphaerae bacterium]